MKLVDLVRQHEALEPALSRAIGRVVADASFIQGLAVAEFEAAFAAYLGVPHVVGCGSGTDALQIAFMALGIGPGDEVITTPFTFVATVEAMVLLGARPVFVDIDARTFNLRADQIEECITPRTRAIVPVHLYGQPADMDEILAIADRHRLTVVEDTAQATGATFGGRQAGTLGTIGCFSFFPAKNLGCIGDGGALALRDAELARACRMIANHGSERRYHHERVGLNSRLDSVQAAVLSVKLPHLASFNHGRQRVAAAYDRGFADLTAHGLATPAVAPGRTHVYQQYTLRSARRDALAEHLARDGVPSSVHYPTPLHRQPAFAQYADGVVDLTGADAAAREVLSLPMFPEMTDTEIDVVTAAVRGFFV
jgi:dTDP-4-amino-4,6-dideoxygalactose transaminase